MKNVNLKCMEIIEIYSPPKMILPGTTNIEPRKKRRIFAENVIHSNGKCVVTFTENEEKRIYEFINLTRNGGASAFTLYFTNINRFIESIIIENNGNHTWTFSIFKENFMLAGNSCEEI